MAQVNLKISAEDKASAVLEKMHQSGRNASDRLSGAFERLGIRSSASIEKSRADIVSAYERIEKSGVATTEEITRAHAAMQTKLGALADQGAGRIRRTWDSLKAHWLGITAAIAGAWIAVSQAWSAGKDAAQGLQQRQAFVNLAASHGAAADSILADLKRVSAGTIATRELVEKAGTSMLLGIAPENLSKMMEIARASSRVTGQTITKSFEDISLAVGRQSRMILDNLGIIVQVEKANEAYAATLGKTASELTDAEKKQAFLNATMEAGEEILARVGLEGETAMERLQRLEATMANLRETAGRGVLAVMAVLGGVFQGVAGFALRLVGALDNVIASLLSLVGATETAEEFRLSAEAALAGGADLYRQSAESITSAADLISGKLDPATAAIQRHAEAQNAAEEAAKKEAEALKEAEAAVDGYRKAIGDLGADVLRFAESGFSDDLKRQEEYLEKNGKLAANLRQPLETYLGVIGQVYGAQVEAQKKISEVLEAIGSDEKKKLDQAIAASQAEKNLAEARLKGWESYYQRLETMHSATLETMAKKQEELLEVKKFGEDLAAALEEKFQPAEALSPYEAFYTKLDAIDAATTEALKLKGDEKVEALKKVMQSLDELPTKIEDGGALVVSSLEIYDQATGRLDKLRQALEGTKQAELDAAGAASTRLQVEINAAEASIAGFRSEVLDLGSKISELSQRIQISLDDQASGKLGQIRAAIDALQDKTVNISVAYTSTIPSSGSAPSVGGSPPTLALGSFSVGTRRIPKTGLYQLHEGEEVKNPREASSSPAGRSTIVQVAPGAVQVVLPAARADRQSAKEVAREIFGELEALGRRKRSTN
ncbi:hypothetical protein [Desulfuromonas sp. TF]|uniref:hypothetical protein n=1 Tax=Desulfuromonas sp. TF TaxID=1232410 RepID=UPI00041C78CB|nr:hypothetical protein [Desulfuromonas sp. TF]